MKTTEPLPADADDADGVTDGATQADAEPDTEPDAEAQLEAATLWGLTSKWGLTSTGGRGNLHGGTDRSAMTTPGKLHT